MRTEEELRAALLALEREAPAAARVLPKTIIPNDNGLLPRVTRHRRLAGLTAALGAAAVIGAGVAVVVALLPGTTAGSHPQAQALPSHQVLRAKLLDALSAAGGEIVYDRITYLGIAPSPGMALQSWYYPLQAKAGQRVRSRTLSVSRGGTSQDVGDSYLEPTEPRQASPDEYAIQPTTGEYIGVDYATRTWVKGRMSIVGYNPLGAQFYDSDFGSAAGIMNLVRSENWSVVGRTELDGRPAIELKIVHPGAYLWIDAQTYLPLRETTDFPGYATRVDYQYLAPTPANLAKLTVPIPAGFRRTVPPPMP